MLFSGGVWRRSREVGRIRATTLLLFVTLLLASCRSADDAGQRAPTIGSTEARPGASVNGVTVAELEGTWIGELVEPQLKDTWSMQLVLRECDRDEECGGLRAKMKGEPLTCVFGLIYEGIQGGAFIFRETVESGPCSPARGAIVPTPDGRAIAFQPDPVGRGSSVVTMLREAA